MSPVIDLINPLPRALAHYDRALMQTLRANDFEVRQRSAVAGEGLIGLTKLTSAIRMVVERIFYRPRGADITMVLWPIMGSLEGMLWLWPARRSRVIIVVHDPRSLTQSGRPNKIQRWFAGIGRGRIEYVTHSELAASHLLTDANIRSTVRRHPIVSAAPANDIVKDPAVIRVLGQYKEARNLALLEEFARAVPPHVALEVIGRGWPQIEGWHVRSSFVPEDEFEALIRSSTAVIVPYSRVYQSGVVLRCLEALTPVIGPATEQMSEVFSADWVGLLDEAETSVAVERVLTHLIEAQPGRLREQLEGYRESYRVRASRDWLSV